MTMGRSTCSDNANGSWKTTGEMVITIIITITSIIMRTINRMHLILIYKHCKDYHTVKGSAKRIILTRVVLNT